MSLLNFYQTFYQTEQLFRLDDDPFGALPPVAVVQIETPLADAEPPAQIEPVRLLITPELEPPQPDMLADLLIDEPVEEVLVDLEPVVGPPVILDPVPAKIMPSTHRPDVPGSPLLNHKVLILVDEELLPSDVLFLEKILNAINLNINGVDLLNVHGLQGIDFEPILADKVIHHFLTFGVPFQRLNLDILMDRYQPVRFHGITFMMADPLAAIEGDKILKKRLWEALKRIFLMG